MMHFWQIALHYLQLLLLLLLSFIITLLVVLLQMPRVIAALLRVLQSVSEFCNVGEWSVTGDPGVSFLLFMSVPGTGIDIGLQQQLS